jgi:hypothetical protein
MKKLKNKGKNPFLSIILIFLLASCSSADVTVLGLKKYHLQKKKGAKNLQVTQDKSARAIYLYSENGEGEILGQVVCKDSSQTNYALVSIAAIKQNWQEESWKNYRSNKYGRFQIKNIPYGKYKLASCNDNTLLTVKDSIDISLAWPQINIEIEIIEFQPEASE